MKKAVIVIPTFNESKNIEKLVTEVFSQQKNTPSWDLEILIVDSRSPDKTGEEVKKQQKSFKKLHLITTEKEGLGKAYIAGFTYALKHLDPVVLFEMDADLSHAPAKIPEFLRQIDDGSDFVIGARYIEGGSIPEDWAIHRKLFSILGNFVVRFGMMKLSVSDWTSGFRALKKWVVKDITPELSGFSGYVFQVALLDKAMKRGAKISEVPINFIDRKHGISKINSVQYIIQTLWYVFTNSSFIKFAFVGFIGAVLDFGISYLLIEKARWYLWLATIISAETAIISNFLFNNFWSFSHKKLEKSISLYMRQFFKFNLVSTGGLAIQAGGIELAALVFGVAYWYIYKIIIIIGIIIPYSYVLYNRVIWKEKKA